jgi:hypothetical protein
MNQCNAERLLVGVTGWSRPAWCQAYYPEDLPSEWRLAYLANDADCLWLAADDLAGLDPGAFAAAWDESGGGLEVYCEAGTAGDALAEVVGDALAVFEPAADDGTAGLWRECGGPRHVARWALDSFDLRAARTHVERLTVSVTALCLDGPAGSPARLPELRTLIDLLGR